MKYMEQVVYLYNIETYVRNGMDVQHVHISDFIGPMAMRLCTQLPIPTVLSLEDVHNLYFL